MSYNGSGTFNINTAGQPVVTGTTITSTAFNLLTADLATGLSTALTKDGQTTPTANIPLGGFKITGLGAGTAATDAAQYGQLQAGATTIATVTGTDTYVGTLSPAIAAYATGNLFSFVAPNTNTGAATINLNSLGAKNITKLGSTALAAGDIVSGRVYQIEYDGTRFQLLNPSASTVASFSAGSTGFTPSSATTGAVTLAGTLATTNGGTGLTSFTANGVVYASSSSALTTGSALNFNGTNLGIGATPSSWTDFKLLELPNGAHIASYTGGVNILDIGLNYYFNGAGYIYKTSDYAEQYVQRSGEHRWYNAPSGTAGNTITFTQAMTLDASGNLGVGTTNTTPANGTGMVVGSAGTIARIDMRNSTTGLVSGDGTSFYLNGNDFTIENRETGFVAFATSSTERARIDSSGNFGIGMTPTNFGNGYTVLQVANATNGGMLYLTNTSNAGGRIYGNAAGLTHESFGATYQAFNTNSSERARIDSSGNLLVNTTSTGAFFDAKVNSYSPDTYAPFSGKQGSDSAAVMIQWNAATSGNNIFTYFVSEASPTIRGSITYNRGAGLIAYNVTSDYRAKDIYGFVTDSGALIDSVPVYMGKIKGATQERPMFIAHETPAYAHTGEKDAVDKDGNPVYQQMDASALIPVMWAEIQSLRKRLADAGI